MKIIVPIQPRGFGEFHSLVEEIGCRAQFVEVWLDQLHDEEFFDVLDQVTNSCCSLVGCCKDQSEHGFFDGSEGERVKILKRFLDVGGKFIDLDITQNHEESIRKIDPENLILSFHDFDGVPENLTSTFERMKKFNPAIYKFSVTTNDEESLERFLAWARETHTHNKVIFSTMGKFGARGRAQIQKENLSWAEFVALDERHKTAPGQRTLPDLQI